jgi:hypothetical protein
MAFHYEYGLNKLVTRLFRKLYSGFTDSLIVSISSDVIDGIVYKNNSE